MFLRAHGVDQLSRATQDRVRGSVVSTSSPGRITVGSKGLWGRTALLGDSGPFPRPTLRTSCPWSLGTVFEIPWCRTAFPGVSCLVLRAPGVDQLSRATGVFARDLPSSTSFLGDSGPGPRASVVDQFSRATGVRVRVHTWSTISPGPLQPRSVFPRGRPALPGDSGPGPRARVVDQLSRVTRAGTEGPRC